MLIIEQGLRLGEDGSRDGSRDRGRGSTRAQGLWREWRWVGMGSSGATRKALRLVCLNWGPRQALKEDPGLARLRQRLRQGLSRVSGRTRKVV